MAGFSTHLAHALINHVFRGSPYSAPAGVYLALFVADPTDDNVTANEVTGGWYARQQITSFTAPSAGLTSNSNTLTFPAVTGSAVTITHWGIYDAATTGNLLASGALSAATVLNVNDVYVISAGDLDLTWA
jgi:hypothetical protein